jgi:hypothetical protein
VWRAVVATPCLFVLCERLFGKRLFF